MIYAKTQLDRIPLQSAQLHNSWGIDLTFQIFRFVYFQSDDEIDDNEDDVDDLEDVEEEEEEKEDQVDISSHMFAFPIRCC